MLGASPHALLYLKVQASPLAAMQIVRGLCHRADPAAPGALAWLHPDDTPLAPYFFRPTAYVLVEPDEVGLDAPDGVLVAAGLTWAEVLLPTEQQLDVVSERDGLTRTIAQFTGAELRAAAEGMVAVLARSSAELAISSAALGLSALIGRGAGAALVAPIAAVLRDPSATDASRETAAHLLAEANAFDPILELVPSPLVMGAFRLAVVEAVAALAVDQPLHGSANLGLPRGFRLDHEARLADLEAAIDRHPDRWRTWFQTRSI